VERGTLPNDEKRRRYHESGPREKMGAIQNLKA
jgi:hypothetical protein